MSLSTIYGNHHFVDRLSCGSFDVPAGTVVDADVNAAAAVQASKLQHQHVISYSQATVADTITDESRVLYICKGVGQIIGVEVTSEVAPDADTDFVTIDVNKVRAGVSASVLTADIIYNNTNAKAGDGGDANGNYGIVTGTIDGAEDDTVDNDIIEIDITHTDNGGTNASGICVNIVIREAA